MLILNHAISGTPGRESNFSDRSRNFEAHAAKLADTANMVATAGGCRNKKTVEEIFKSSNQVRNLIFNPFPNKPLFLCVCGTSLLKMLWGKENCL